MTTDVSPRPGHNKKNGQRFASTSDIKITPPVSKPKANKGPRPVSQDSLNFKNPITSKSPNYMKDLTAGPMIPES